MTTTSRITKRMIARSHEAQFIGADYQCAARAVLDGLPLGFEPTDEEIGELETSPDPGCDCGFCGKANFQ